MGHPVEALVSAYVYHANGGEGCPQHGKPKSKPCFTGLSLGDALVMEAKHRLKAFIPEEIRIYQNWTDQEVLHLRIEDFMESSVLFNGTVMDAALHMMGDISNTPAFEEFLQRAQAHNIN